MGKTAPQGVNATGAPPSGDAANAVLSGSFVAVGPSAPFAFRGPMDMSIYASYNTTLTTVKGSSAGTLGAAGTVAAGTAVNSVLVPPGTTVASIAGAVIQMAFPPISLVGDFNASLARITGLRKTLGLVGATIVSPYFPAGTTVLGITQAAAVPLGSNPGDGAGTYGIVQTSAAPSSTPLFKGPYPITFLPTNDCVVTGADTAALFTGAAIVYSGTIQLERSFDGCATWIPANIGGSGTLAQWNAGTPVSLTFGEPEKQIYYRLNCLAYVSGVINYRISQTGGAAESLAIGALI